MFVMISGKLSYSFLFNDTATTEIYTLSLHDALPISFHQPHKPDAVAAEHRLDEPPDLLGVVRFPWPRLLRADGQSPVTGLAGRSEEHTSELQSRQYLVCRLLLEHKYAG